MPVMAFLMLGLVYAFAAACFTNYFIMFVRIRTTEKYVERREKLLEAYHKRQEQHDGAADADTTAAAAGDNLMPEEGPLRVVFLHPDLGIGGAERLVVDAAVGLLRHQSARPVEVTIVTNHHDPTRAFKETVDGTLRVVVRGSAIPASIMGRGKVLCATVRMAFAAFATCWAFPETHCFVVDQVAAAMPMLQFCAGKTPVLYYSHFPDQLCDPNRNDDGTLKDGIVGHTTYRGFFDTVEQRSLGFATSIVCNSKFSRQVTVETFPELAERIDEENDIFYPPVNMDVHHVSAEAMQTSEALQALRDSLRNTIAFVSINRYERKKNLMLAVEAFSLLIAMDEFDPTATPQKLMLVVAGGYDPRLEENVQYAAELAEHAKALKIPSDQIRFMHNISDDEKALLLSSMRALVYTPSREHFGIVPVEAMAYGKPVVAVANGGPCESVGDAAKEDPSTCGGLLCAAEPAAFAEKMAHFARLPTTAEKVGAQGRARILQQFSLETFSSKLVRRLTTLVRERDAVLLKEGLEEEAKAAAKKAATTSTAQPAAAGKEKTE